MKKIILMLVLILFTSTYNSYAENEYFKVISSTPCSNELEIESSSNLEIGDKIVLIQMNGAIIDRSNTEKYGDIIDFNGAGQFEFNEVMRKNGNKITFKYKIKDGYDFTAAIQLIKVENVKNLIVNSNPNVKAWDGTTGGVLVLYAEESITLNSDIDVSGKGFRGAKNHLIYHWSQLEKEYFYNLNTLKAARKGEGIAIYDTNYAAGRGKNANGGGGGNAADGGGGGGGNLSFGGRGGDATTYYLIQRNGLEKGLGGGLSKFDNYPLILGGGSGAGAMNHNLTYDGVSGGGIVLIMCKTLNANNHKIISNGSNEKRFTGTEGAPGGGGAGAIYVNIENLENNLFIEAIGGEGGWVDARGLDGVVQNECMGPGGGGGGGTLYLVKEINNVISDLNGGKSGMVQSSRSECTGTKYGSTDGEIGKRLIYPLPIQNEEYTTFKKNEILSDDIIGNCGIIAKWLSSKLSQNSYKWFFDGSIISNEQRVFVEKSGKYVLITQSYDICKNIIYDTLEIDIFINISSGEKQLEVTTNKIYFENAKQTILSTKEFGIKNISQNDYLLEKILFSKNVNFSLPKSSLPKIIKPNETKYLTVVFQSNHVDNYKDTLIIFDQCKDIQIELETDIDELNLKGKNKCDLEWSIGNQINNDSFKEQIIITPNPTTDYIQINKLNINELKTIKIYDNLGNLHLELSSNQIKENIDVETLPTGIYFIELMNNNNTTIFSKFNKIK